LERFLIIRYKSNKTYRGKIILFSNIVVIIIKKNDGTEAPEYSYDEWGRRRRPTNWARYDTIPNIGFIDRGYTGHEHYDIFGLIDMNGRVYDPVIGRFLSPDPYIQAPDFTQSYNSYSYCLNNPLKYTDPSGYSYSEDPLSAYFSACLRGYAGGYSDFSDLYYDKYYNYLFSGGGGGVSGSGGSGGFTISWETKFTFTNGTSQEVRDGNKKLLYILLPDVGVGYIRGSVYVGGTNSFNNAASGGDNAWGYISNGASVGSGYPTISGTWAYNTSGGEVAWTGKNGNYYKLSQVRNNGGYVKSMNYASRASQLSRNIGNGLTITSMVTGTVSTGIAVANGNDNTSTWVGFGVTVIGGAVTIFDAPVWVTGAAIGGAIYGIGQLFWGDEINGWIDRNVGYEGGILKQLGF
jgi:RHS repeat-associated protein